MNNLAITYKATADLLPYINNAKKHSGDQVAMLAASIREFGFNNPILTDGDNGVIAGHGRLQAAQKLGLETVPTIELSHLSAAQKKAYILADNRLGEVGTEWDMELVNLELEALQGLDFDLSLTGFELELGDEEPDYQGDPDDTPALSESEPVSQRGMVWLCGNHRVMCGDSTNKEQVRNLMGEVYPDLIHTDPPYGMNAVSKSSVLKKNYKTDIIGDNNPDVAKNAFSIIYGMYPNSNHVWWGANYYCSSLPDSECWIVWDKNNGASDQTDCELAWANFRSVVRQFTLASEKTNRVHPTQKPVPLVEWVINRFSIASKTIADFFGGSGSTIIAAEKNQIQGFIMEFDPKYCDVIVKRWQQFTGKDATLENDGRTFNEIASLCP